MVSSGRRQWRSCVIYLPRGVVEVPVRRGMLGRVVRPTRVLLSALLASADVKTLLEGIVVALLQPISRRSHRSRFLCWACVRFMLVFALVYLACLLLPSSIRSPQRMLCRCHCSGGYFAAYVASCAPLMPTAEGVLATLPSRMLCHVYFG